MSAYVFVMSAEIFVMSAEFFVMSAENFVMSAENFVMSAENFVMSLKFFGLRNCSARPRSLARWSIILRLPSQSLGLKLKDAC